AAVELPPWLGVEGVEHPGRERGRGEPREAGLVTRGEAGPLQRRERFGVGARVQRSEVLGRDRSPPGRERDRGGARALGERAEASQQGVLEVGGRAKTPE